MESIGAIVRDLIRQFLAFAFPGAFLLLAFIHAHWGMAAFLPIVKENLPFFALMGYGVSVAVGFALHCVTIPSLHRRDGFSNEKAFRWIGEREADFQAFASDSARHHHRRLLAYWQMCTSMVLSSLLGGTLILIGMTGSTTLLWSVTLVEAAFLLLALAFGHRYMQILVESYEARTIEVAMSKGPPAGPPKQNAPFAELLTFQVPADERERWLARDEQVWTAFLSDQAGYAGKQVWVPDEPDQPISVVVWWESKQSWQQITEDQIAAVDAKMGDLLHPPMIRVMRVRHTDDVPHPPG